MTSSPHSPPAARPDLALPRLAMLRWAFGGVVATLVLLYGAALVPRDARPAAPSSAPALAPGPTF